MSITPPAVTTAVTAIQTAVTAVGTLQGASDYALAPVVTAILSAQAVIAGQITATDSLVGTGGSMASGTPPLQAINWLAGQTAATATEANLLNIQAYVGRIAINIAQRL